MSIKTAMPGVVNGFVGANAAAACQGGYHDINRVIVMVDHGRESSGDEVVMH